MNKVVMKLASPGKRLGAYIIDKIVPVILLCVMVATVVGISAMNNLNSAYGYGLNISVNGAGILGTAVSILVVIALAIAYLVVQIYFYTKSKTIGKAILGLQVISSADGQPIGVFMMIIREWFAKKASGAVFLLGYLWILIDDKNRGWHDKIMDTYVVDLNETVKYNNKANTEVKEDIVNIEPAIQEVPVDTNEGGNNAGEQ